MQIPVQDFTQLHFTNSRHTLDASSNPVHHGYNLPLISWHPQKQRSRLSCNLCIA